MRQVFPLAVHCSHWTVPAILPGPAGSNVSLTLYFVRFALLMNFIILAIWVCLTVFPFFDSPPSTFSWSIFRQEPAKDMLQGYGLDNTFLLYGECGAMALWIPACRGQASRVRLDNVCCCAAPCGFVSAICELICSESNNVG